MNTERTEQRQIKYSYKYNEHRKNGTQTNAIQLYYSIYGTQKERTKDKCNTVIHGTQKEKNNTQLNLIKNKTKRLEHRTQEIMEHQLKLIHRYKVMEHVQNGNTNRNLTLMKKEACYAVYITKTKKEIQKYNTAMERDYKLN